MSVFKAIKKAVLSGTLLSNAIYFIKGVSDTVAKAYVTDGSGNAVPIKNTVGDVTAGTGVAVYGDLSTGDTQIALTGQALSLHSVSGDGFIYRTSGIVGTRKLQAGSNITITYPDGVGGNPVISAGIGDKIESVTTPTVNNLSIDSDTNIVEFSSAVNIINGIQGADGRRLILRNMGSTAIKLNSNSTSSSVGNRFLLYSSPFGIKPYDSIEVAKRGNFWYLESSPVSSLIVSDTTLVSSLQDIGLGATYTYTTNYTGKYEANGIVYYVIVLSNIESTGTATGTFKINLNNVGVGYVLSSSLNAFSGSNKTRSDISILQPTFISSDEICFRDVSTATYLKEVEFTSGNIYLTITASL